MTNDELLANAKVDVDAACYAIQHRQIQIALQAVRAAQYALEELEQRLRDGGIIAVMKLGDEE